MMTNEQQALNQFLEHLRQQRELFENLLLYAEISLVILVVSHLMCIWCLYQLAKKPRNSLFQFDDEQF